MNMTSKTLKNYTFFCYLFYMLAYSSLVEASHVKGHIDNPGTDYENFTIKGWACQTGKNQSLNTRIIFGGKAGVGTFYKSVDADKSSEKGVANACKNSHFKNRFSYKMPLKDIYKYRGKSIFVHGISTIGSGNSPIHNSGKYRVPSAPTSKVTGRLDPLYKSGSLYYVKGFACQTGYKTPISVEVYAGGTLILKSTANRSTGSSVAVTNYCKTSSQSYGFKIEIPASKLDQYANKKIQVRGVSLIGTGNSEISGSSTYTLPPKRPNVPSKIYVPKLSQGYANISWNGVSGEINSYRLERKFNGKWGQVYKGTKRIVTFKDLKPGEYQYRVRACNSRGCSGYRTSSILDVTSVKGYVENPGSNYEDFTIQGWSCQTGHNVSLDTRIIFGGRAGEGKLYKAVTANKISEAGVANACSNTHRRNRFSYSMSLKDIYEHRGKSIYIHGISTVGSGNSLLHNSGEYTVPEVPTTLIKGHIDGLTETNEGVYVKGWACQTNYTKPVEVRVLAGGVAGSGGVLVAKGIANNATGSGVSKACNTSGRAYGFNVKIPSDALEKFAGKDIFVHGISLVGNGNKAIGESGKLKIPTYVKFDDNLKEEALNDLSNYAFEPFYKGQMKSLEALDATKAGNSIELSAKLLHRVYKRLGDSANTVNLDDFKVVQGRILVRADVMRRWLGIERDHYINLILKYSLLEPVKKTIDNIDYFEFIHHWVKIGDKEIDPSFKTHEKIQKLNLSEDIDIHAKETASVLIDKSQSGGEGLFYPNPTELDEILYNNEEKIAEYLSQADVKYGDYISQRKPTGLLDDYVYSSALPYTVISRDKYFSLTSLSNPFSFVPDNYKHKVKITIDGLTASIDVSEATQKSLFIDYVPRDSNEEAKIEEYGGILNTPAYQVSMKPRVNLGEDVLTTSTESVKAGAWQDLEVSFCIGDTCESVGHSISVGGVHAIAIDALSINPELIAQAPKKLESLSVDYASNLLDSRFSGPLLAYLGRLYFRHLDLETAQVSSAKGVLIYNNIHEALISFNLSTRNVNGQKILSVGQRQIDAARMKYSIAPTDNTHNFDQAPIVYALGVTASSLEHSVFAKVLGWHTESTMSVLRYAAMNEEPILVLDKNNFSDLEDELIKFDADTIQNFRDQTNRGRLIITTKGPQNILETEYVAYINLNRENGSGRYIINGINGGIGPLNNLSQHATNSTFTDYVSSIIDHTNVLGLAALDGILLGDRNEKLYETTLETNVANGAAFGSDIFMAGDFRNIGFELYDFYQGDGSFTNLGISILAILPVGDVAKIGYKYSDDALTAVGLIGFKTTLINVSDKADVILGNLGRFSDKIVSSTVDTLHGVSAGITVAKRGNIEVKNITISDRANYESAIGRPLGVNPTKTDRGEFAEYAGRDYAVKYLKYECYYCVDGTVPQGVDGIFKDKAGNFIIQETKWISASTNVGAGSLSNWTSKDGQKYKQMSKEWIFGTDGTGIDSALSRSGLNKRQIDTLVEAFRNGNVRTQLVVMKPKHLGAGVTKGMANHKQLGADSGLPLNDIVIIEMGN